MKILLSGVETNNKGAELMLYAILQEIENKIPDAKVYIPPTRISQGLKYIKTNLDLRYTSSPIIGKLTQIIHLRRLFRILHLPLTIFAEMDIIKDAEWFIDGSGFVFGDQSKPTHAYLCEWKRKFFLLKKNGCKIIFLPQSFGPAKKSITRRVYSTLSENASVIMPRDKVSYNYLKETGVVDMSKVQMFTDFTSLVNSVFPSDYEHLINGICVIPNRQMINSGKITYSNYIELLTSIIDKARKSGRPVYLLNHEGIKDEQLINKCKKSIGGDIEVVTRLNALEVKGLIASAYMVVTSRFHGLVSALNSGVPALATSWSHKYEELFNDYCISSSVLPLDDLNKALKMVEEVLNKKNNNEIREHLKSQLPRIKEENRKMWESIWRL